MEEIVMLNSLFSTADIEDIDYEFEGSDLIMRIVDWQEILYELRFRDVQFLKEHTTVDEEKFSVDSPHEILDSEKIRQQGLDPAVFHHHMLCFNPWGAVEIISAQLEITKPKTPETLQ